MRPTDQELFRMAVKASENAYVPFSNFHVGAALLTKDGKIYTGCNIENAAYSPSVCAERTAVFKAVSEGNREFSSIAVTGGPDGKIEGSFPPCGVCRQVLAEFCAPEMPVYLVESDAPLRFKTMTLGELLPESFTPKNLGR